MRVKPRQPFLNRALSPGLVGAWPLSEASGVVARDFSGYNNHGAISAANWVATERGPSLQGDGASTGVNVGDVPELQITGSLTVAVLLNHATLGDTRYVCVKRGYGIYINNNNPTFITRKADNSDFDASAAGGALTPGAWHLLTGVYSAEDQVKALWVNTVSGTPVAKTDATCGAISGFEFRFGSYYTGVLNYAGIIAAVYVWNRALVAAQIRKLHADAFEMLRPKLLL